MRKPFVVSIICLMLLPVVATSQTHRTSKSKRPAHTSSSTAAAAQKQATEIRAAREKIATQVKALTQFLYLLGSISKSIETAEQANRSRERSSLSMPPDQIEKNKAKVKDSIRNVRAGLEGLESDLRSNPALTNYYPFVAGVARIAQDAESQATANNFDAAGRTLLTAVNKLADALVSTR